MTMAMNMKLFRSLASRTRAISRSSYSPTAVASCSNDAAAAATATIVSGRAATLGSSISYSRNNHPAGHPQPQLLLHQHRNIHIEKKLTDLQIVLPSAPMPKANYNIVCRVPGENIMYVSGHLPIGVSISMQSKHIVFIYIIWNIASLTRCYLSNKILINNLILISTHNRWMEH
jgi:hypothetical protein